MATPKHIFNKSWKKHLHPNTLLAFDEIQQKEGKSDKQTRAAQVFEFVCKACSPGAKWMDVDGTWHQYDGAVCYRDLGNYFGTRDQGTTFRPGFHALKYDYKVLTYAGTKPHPLTGKMTDYFRPRKPNEPTLEKPPSGLQMLRWAIFELRELAKELNENDEWTTKLLDVLYDPDVISAMEGRKHKPADDIGSNETI